MTIEQVIQALQELMAEYGPDEEVHVRGFGPVFDVDPGNSEGMITIYGSRNDD